jgi:NAD+ synthase (glutamine-hydrolysing)
MLSEEKIVQFSRAAVIPSCRARSNCRIAEAPSVFTVRVALAQINPTVGDLDGNEQKILDHIAQAREVQADIVAFPELVVPGYPPEDLLLKPSFVAANLACLERIAGLTRGITAIVGFVDRKDDLYNAAAVLHEGRVAAVYHKAYLPNYAVFDEDRYFRAGERPLVLSLGKVTVGINICEDIWHPAGPTKLQVLAGAQLVINISSSPYHAGKGAARERMLATRAADNVVCLAFCNMVGGQDELVFDGGSVVFDERGELVARSTQFAEDLLVADLDLAAVFRQQLHDPRRRKERARQAVEAVQRIELTPIEASRPGRSAASPPIAPLLEPAAEIYQALVLGTRDYVRKNGFREAVIGLSGGIDSALTATIAADALGPENVVGVFMPSRYSSVESREDATQLAENLGARFLTVSIDETFQAYLEILAEPFAGLDQDVTEENIQARIRGNILMALSNKFGWLVLTTGNKSEMSVGYATLYGDMAGGFAVIKDVPKMLVYQLAEHVNAREDHPAIPQRMLDKAPTAELRPDQRDEDSLPPYRVLDPILHAYVEEDRGLEEIVALGFNPDTVSEVLSMVDRAEYKRRQAPPGVRITPRAFGKDRRLPITNHYRDAGS